MDPDHGPSHRTTTAPAEAPERPTFYYGFASAECWLAAERVNHVLPEVPVWQPIRAPAPAASPPEELARRAAAQGLLPLRRPDAPPGDLDLVLRAAAFAQAAGRVVAFSLAALRQAFAAGRDLSKVDDVLVAAAACELHPRAVLKGIESRGTEERLRAASEEAERSGVRGVPAIGVRGRIFHGPDAVERAAQVLRPSTSGLVE